jgi:tRNA pseudouridine32 synthase/23S rRNA pseudouridine746 synthase
VLTSFAPPPSRDELPAALGDPFAAVPPHPLARRAAEGLQKTLRSGPLGQVDLEKLACPGEGKMFGVLVVLDPAGGAGYLSAFSGMLDGRWQVEGFVPPVFDTAARDAFWPACEEEWRRVDRQLAELVAPAQSVCSRLEELAARHAAELSALRERHAVNQRSRQDERRALESAALDEVARRRALHALGFSSRADEVEQRGLSAAHRQQREVLRSEQRALDGMRRALEAERAERSRKVWRRITEGYLLPSLSGEERTLASLYAPEPPPGGAGDCAAPKLLAYALRQRLQPLALAEFWWGAAPAAGERIAGAYYPACRPKCGVVLPWMLAGGAPDRLRLPALL